MNLNLDPIFEPYLRPEGADESDWNRSQVEKRRPECDKRGITDEQYNEETVEQIKRFKRAQLGAQEIARSYEFRSP